MLSNLAPIQHTLPTVQDLLILWRIYLRLRSVRVWPVGGLWVTRLDRHGDGVQGAADGLAWALVICDAVVLGPVEDAVVVAARVRDLEHGRDLAVLEVGLGPERHRRDVGVAHDAFADGVEAVDWGLGCE